MSVVEYDLDSSGGIMEQIQKLVAPPISDDAARRSRRRNRTAEHRRHGRAVNHDCCDSCKEGGDLLCCDRCPAAFHLLCHDPPLEEDDLPPGEWVCHRCRVTPSEGKDDDAESTSSSRSNRMKRPAPQESVAESEPSTSAAGLVAKDNKEDDKGKEGDNPFHLLVKAARLMNPVQFELSKDIACSTPLPGSSKRVYGRNYRAPKKQAHELDNGLVPLPAKVCFTCTKSCRVGPLIQCDYCPLLFHMDCLNPPLTSLPTGRWMCPNHVEHFLDEYMVRSNSLNERIKLWDKFSGVVDQHAVKLNFLKHVHRPHPPFRVKRRLPARKTVTVPEAIKEHYRNPAALLPLPQRAAAPVPEPAIESKASVEATPEEQEEWLSSVVSLQTSIAKHLTQKQLQKNGSTMQASDGSKPTDASGPTAKPTASVAPVIHRESESFSSAATSTSDSVAKGTESVSSSGESVNKAGQDPVNGPSEQSQVCGSVKPSAISLLHGNLTSSGAGGAVNGDTEILDVQKAKVEAAVRTRSNSADAAGVIKVSWHGSDKTVNQTSSSAGPSAGGAHTTLSAASSSQPQGKNIVISTINKANNTVVTKVLPSGSSTNKVVLPPGVAARSVTGSSPTSILSPRVLVQPSVQRLGMASSPNQGTAGTQTKVISVSTSTSGSKTATVVSAPKGVTGSLPAILNLNSALQQWIEGGSDVDVDMTKLDDKLLQLLAWQRLQQLLPPSSPVGSSTSPAAASKKGLLNGLLTPGDNEVRARAVLCPLTGKGQAISMPFRTLSMGTGADMDVTLYQFGHCNFISSKHAVIFYDEMTRHFELLNYSEFGTTVDNVLYSCDFSDKPATTPQPSPVVAAVREIIGKNSKKDKDKEREEQQTKDKRYIMSARSREPGRPCSCKTNSLSLMGGSGAGWEGTAILHHGSYIRVGCLQFVFSIVDQASQELLPPPRVKPPEQMSLLKTHLKAAQ